MLYFLCASPNAAKLSFVEMVSLGHIPAFSKTRKTTSLKRKKYIYSCNKRHENSITDQCLIIHDTSEHTVNTSLFCNICFDPRQFLSSFESWGNKFCSAKLIKSCCEEFKGLLLIECFSLSP